MGEIVSITPDRTPRPRRFVVGVDLGLSIDHSAIVVDALAEVSTISWVTNPNTDPPTQIVRGFDWHHDIVLAERIPLATPYAAVIARLCEVTRKLPPRPHAPIVVLDASGVGRPIVDAARNALASCGPSIAAVIGAVITGGASDTWSEAEFVRVSKRALVTRAQARLQSGQMRIAADLPQAEPLVEELRAFEAKITASGHVTFGGTGGAHDDLIAALTLCCWAGEEVNPQPVYRLLDGFDLISR